MLKKFQDLLCVVLYVDLGLVAWVVKEQRATRSSLNNLITVIPISHEAPLAVNHLGFVK